MKISRWKVFELENGEYRILCKNCDNELEYGGERPEVYPKVCRSCGAIMIGHKCWFPPKE